MRNGLILLERIVIESFGADSKSLQQIERDTSLPLGVVKKIIENLRQRKLVKGEGPFFQLDWSNDENWEEVHSAQAKCDETKELCNQMIENYFFGGFGELKLRKIEMTGEEQNIFSALLKNVDSFIEQIEFSRKKSKGPSSPLKQKVVWWGSSGYDEILKGHLKII